MIDKDFIVSQLKPLSLKDIKDEMNKLMLIGANMKEVKPLSRVANDVVDYFTLRQRLETKGKMNISFYEFVEQFEYYKEKKYIKTMITFYNKNKKRMNM